jgi:hypothetical protein
VLGNARRDYRSHLSFKIRKLCLQVDSVILKYLVLVETLLVPTVPNRLQPDRPGLLVIGPNLRLGPLALKWRKRNCGT